jgi:hypothetical protein
VNEDRLRRRLRDHPVPDEEGARERGWRVVSEARATTALRPRRRSRRLALAAVAAGSLAVLALTPPGAAVGDWIRDTIDPGRDDAQPALDSLPAPGRLLVTSAEGTWIVHADGSERRLGPFGEADWSPQGLFVAVTRGRRLIAVNPLGEVHWSLARDHSVSRPSWSPEPGFRVAYLSGTALRVVAGDGTGDHPLAREVAPVTPSWQPGPVHRLAYAEAGGGIVVQNADTVRVAWRRPAGAPPLQLEWTDDGRRLVALAETRLRVFTAQGRLVLDEPMPAGRPAAAMALHPGGKAVAIVRSDGSGGSEAVALDLGGTTSPRRLFAGQGHFSDVAWSPDGRWILLAWPEADQWLFIRSTAVRRITAVSGVGRQFDPAGEGPAAFPRLAGWCCR